jgi:hypothetical protein
MIGFNKHVHDIDIFINDKWRKYTGGDIGQLFKIAVLVRGRNAVLCYRKC